MSFSARLVRIPPASGRRLAGIEGLRAVAATTVLVSHSWFYSNPDGIRLWHDSAASIPFESMAFGVTLFFALSGFLLYRPFLVAAFEPDRRPSVAAYFRNRALRILPAYWVILLVVSLVLQSALVRGGADLHTGALTNPGDLLSAAFLLQDYRPSTTIIGIGPSWSLAVELVFYLALPLLGALALRLARRASDSRGILLASLAPAALMLLIGISGKLAAQHLVANPGPAGGYDASWHTVIVRSFWAQADLFAFGMAVAAVHVQVARGALRLPSWWRPAAIAVAVPVGLAAALRLAGNDGQLGYPIDNTAIALVAAIGLALVVLPASSGGASRAARGLEAPAAVALGLVSYSLFLWHEPVVYWLRDHGLVAAGTAGFLLNTAVLFVISVALAMITYRLIEVPALRHKARATSAARAGPVAAAEPLPSQAKG
jgi:peptidoglycan/LPS O-acetylase OafA/YrhL